MNRMEIGPISRENVDGRVRVSAVVSTPELHKVVWFSLPDRFSPDTSGNPFLAACLIPAMKLGHPLHVHGSVSGQLLKSVETIQAIFHKWYPELAIVPVSTEGVSEESPPPSPGSAAFFSGGMDSFHTALKHRSQLDYLVFVHGFDIPIINTDLRRAVAEKLQTAAGKLEIDLIEVETNVRELADPVVSWATQYFGPALASVGLLLGNTVGRMLIPASESYAHLEPCASHPLVDPLWSTECVTIIHDGAEASRNEKAAYIADSPVAMEALRVCWENPANAYNCGHCEKCLRTMINLESAGALERCRTFRTHLDPEAVRNMAIGYDLVLFHVEENLRVLDASGRNPAVADALRESIAKYRVSQLELQLRNANSDSSFGSVFGTLIERRREQAFKALWQTYPTWLAKEVLKEILKRLLLRGER